MSKELAKTYDPHGIEDRLYQKWLDKKYFHAEVDESKKPFTIVIPPPNITGQLHMGHALDNTMQDILIRFKRMQGYNALWQPGTDHASIATEVKIIETLKKEGIDKRDLGREGFLKRAWEWKEEYGGRIINQRSWDPPVTGTDSVSRWTKAVIRLLRKYSAACTKKAGFIKETESATGVLSAKLLFLMQRLYTKSRLVISGISNIR